MECDFCENLAEYAVQKGNIEQAACQMCCYSDKLTGWDVVGEFDVSPWDFAG